MKYFTTVVVVVVSFAVISGFLLAGSPQKERLRKFDERRVSDLQSLQWQITDYWQNKQKLPGSLSDLNNDLRGFRVPKDPETGTDYGYQAKGELSFALCARFGLPSQPSDKIVEYTKDPKIIYGGFTGIWDHGAGDICFDRTIDKDFYKKVTN